VSTGNIFGFFTIKVLDYGATNGIIISALSSEEEKKEAECVRQKAMQFSGSQQALQWYFCATDAL
jgi:hypothetical protein